MEEIKFDNVFKAFDHLIENWSDAFPPTLQEAKRRREVALGTKAGSRPLREAGAKSMLKRFGAGRYVVSEVVTYKTQQPNGPAFKSALENIWAENEGDLDETKL